MNARGMDPITARFMQIDPYVRSYPDLNPYNYVLNNPMYYTDPTGLCPEGYDEGDVWNPGDGSGPSYCGPTVEVSATTQSVWQVTLNYERPNYLASFGAFAAKTSITTQADGALPFADAFYTGLLIGKFGITIYDAITFKTQETFEVQTYHIPPGILPGFPGAERVRRRGGRARWKDTNGDILEWDYQHGEIEKWNKRGTKHKGSFDPDTGEPIEGKGPDSSKKKIDT